MGAVGECREREELTERETEETPRREVEEIWKCQEAENAAARLSFPDDNGFTIQRCRTIVSYRPGM